MHRSSVQALAELPREERNLAYLHLLHPDIGPRYPDRDFIAREIVGHLRIAAGRLPEDPDQTLLVYTAAPGSPEEKAVQAMARG
ncbi:hypothetical protein ACQEVY_27140 [Streptomyces sp. CA-288835]|uniref:MmyB family transcriptional regulator n=1 Tax=Streptomyces sp. CA-288835 TaxID=3240069 RepID=UPI003D8A5224